MKRPPLVYIRGNCYVTSEALYHLLGGKTAGWQAMRMRWMGDTHWFIRNKDTGQIVDATKAQFGIHMPDYRLARATGFLTRRPSKRALSLMKRMVWQFEST